MQSGSSGFATETSEYAVGESYAVQQGTTENQRIAGSLTVNGNTTITSGELIITNPFGNGSGIQLINGSPITPPFLPPSYGLFHADDNTFSIFRSAIPDVRVPDSVFFECVPAPVGLPVENDIIINGSTFISDLVSGLSGMKYVTGIKLSSVNDPPAIVNYLGATLYLEPYGTGDGAVTIKLPFNFLTDDIYDGVLVFYFVSESTDTQTVHVVDQNDVNLKTIIVTQNEIVQLFSLPEGLTAVTSPLTSVVLTRLPQINRVKRKMKAKQL